MHLSKRIPWLSLSLIVFLVGCGSSDSSNPSSDPGSGSSATTFSGTIAGIGDESGTFTLSIDGQSSSRLSVLALGSNDVGASGLLSIYDTTFALTGTYNTSTKTFSVTGDGAGGTWTLTGTFLNGVVSGTYTGPNGSGAFSAVDSTENTVTNYCGTFSGSSPEGSINGTWNLSVSEGGQISGVSSLDGEAESFTGTLDGVTVDITFECEENVEDSGTATGAISGSGAAGTWECGAAGGVFIGSSC